MDRTSRRLCKPRRPRHRAQVARPHRQALARHLRRLRRSRMADGRRRLSLSAPRSFTPNHAPPWIPQPSRRTISTSPTSDRAKFPRPPAPATSHRTAVAGTPTATASCSTITWTRSARPCASTSIRHPSNWPARAARFSSTRRKPASPSSPAAASAPASTT